MNAVRATLPFPSTPTGECGFAASTALTAAVRMSKSFELRSKPVLSARSTVTRDRVPRWWWVAAEEPLDAAGAAAGEAGAALAAGAVRALVAPTARTAPAAATAARRDI